MTILEASYRYGTLQTTASVGENLTSVVRRIYQSDDGIYYKIIKTLNLRFDWDCIKPGIIIQYLPQVAADNVSEV